MKARIATSLMALAVLLAASCAKESGQKETAPLPQVPISVEASVSGLTKTVTEGTQTSFVANDQLTLYAWTGSNTAVPQTKVVNGVVNTFDGTKWTPASTMLWKNVKDAHYFLGISPARTVSSFTADPVTSAEDLMVATILGDGIVAPQTVTAPPVNLEFSHMMAVLKINVKYRNQWGGVPQGAQVKALAATAGTINYLTKVITPGTQSAQILTAATTADTGYSATYTALCIPQGFRTMEFVIEGQTLVYTHDADIALEAGKVTTLSLLVGKDKIALENNTVSAWDEGEVNPDMGKISGAVANITRPLTIKALEDGTTVTFTDRSSGDVTWITSDGRSGTISLINNTVSLAAGQRVWFIGDGTNNAFGTGAESTSSRIALNKDCEVYGNIMSLLGPDFATNTTLPGNNTFAYLFSGQTHLKNSAEEGLYLPATTLTEGCYKGLFKGCTGLSQVISAKPDGWSMGEDFPWGFTMCEPGENGPVAVYTAPTALTTNLTYNGSAQTLINAGTVYKAGVALEYSTNGTSWSTTVPKGTNASNYNVYCRVKDGGVKSAALKVTIAAKTVANPTITLATNTYTYDGSAKTPAVSSVKDGSATIPSGEYTVSYSNNTNAGTAKVTITDKSGGNYTVSGSKTFTINKVPCSVASAPTAKSLTFNGSRSNYNGSAQTLVNAGTASGGSMKYKVGNGGWSTNLPSATNAGTYTVYYKAAGDANHIDSAEGSVQVTITKADGFIESTLTTYSTNVFGGNTGTVYASGELSGYVMSNAMGDNMNLKSNNTTPPSYSVSVSTTGPFSYIVLVFSCKESTNYKAVKEKSISLTLVQ